MTALFVLRIPQLWSLTILTWLRQLGSGIANTSMDRDGPYLLLLGFQAVLTACAVLASLLAASPRSGEIWVITKAEGCAARVRDRREGHAAMLPCGLCPFGPRASLLTGLAWYRRCHCDASREKVIQVESLTCDAIRAIP